MYVRGRVGAQPTQTQRDPQTPRLTPRVPETPTPVPNACARIVNKRTDKDRFARTPTHPDIDNPQGVRPTPRDYHPRDLSVTTGVAVMCARDGTHLVCNVTLRALVPPRDSPNTKSEDPTFTPVLPVGSRTGETERVRREAVTVTET